MKKLLFLFLVTILILAKSWLTLNHQTSWQTFPRAQNQNQSTSLTLPGKIKAYQKAVLRFQTSGRLAWVGVEEGDFVKKGQPIAKLDQQELKKELQKTLNNYLKTRWDFEQTYDDYQETIDRHLVTPAIRRILEKAQFDLNNAVLEVELAHLALEYSTLISPIDGIVTKVEAPVAGVNITPATARFTIVNPQSVYFEAEADEEEVVQLKEGAPATIRLDAYPQKTFPSKLIRIHFAPANKQSATVYPVEFELPSNHNLIFRLGMNGEVEVSLK